MHDTRKEHNVQTSCPHCICIHTINATRLISRRHSRHENDKNKIDFIKMLRKKQASFKQFRYKYNSNVFYKKEKKIKWL
jgi:hypothetical protein